MGGGQNWFRIVSGDPYDICSFKMSGLLSGEELVTNVSTPGLSAVDKSVGLLRQAFGGVP
jgi:hypothetical protein